MLIIVLLNGVFAVPIFRSSRRFGLAASVALLTSAILATAVEATATTSASAAIVAMSTTSPATIGTRRAPRARRRVSPTRQVYAPQVSSSRARRARLVRAKAAQKAREYREAEAPLFRTGADGSLVPSVRAEAAIVYNPVTQQVLWEENAQNERSIASITKVMTAVVFLEHALDLTQPVRIEKSDVRAASTTYLRANDVLTPQDLLHLLLIGSDNAAARALARISPFGTEGFVEHMNAKARELGLEHTHYDDPSGLIDTNVSSAYDMARLISFAAGDERIASIMRKSSEQIVTNTRTVNVHSTNKLLLGGDIDVRGGKTGFISKSGYCLATLLQVPNGDPIAVVVLGARSSAGRFLEAKHLFNWMSERTRNLLSAESTAAAQAAPQPQPE
jgi:D-alanyl-D-alanine endopeptidase (penicillin-binding protein 7)